jgi:hypothetical protein
MKWTVSAFDWNAPGTKREIRAATSRKMALRLNAPSTFEFSIPGDHEQALFIKELVTDVVVRGGTEDMLRARCGPSADSVGETNYTVSFKFADYRSVLRRRKLNAADRLQFSNVDQAEIAWRMIQDIQARTNGNYGITQGVGSPTGVLRQWNPGQGAFVGKEIDSLSNLDNGFDWDISPAMALNIYHPQRGANNGVGLEYGKTIRSFDRNITPNNFANDIVATGSNSTVPVETASATISTDPAGRWDGVYGFPDIVMQSTLASRATWLVTRTSVLFQPVYVVQLSPGFWRGLGHIGLGDSLRVVVKRGRINDNLVLRVLEILVDIDDDGGESVRLSLGWA